jgi:hypothetical protein
VFVDVESIVCALIPTAAQKVSPACRSAREDSFMTTSEEDSVKLKIVLSYDPQLENTNVLEED